MKSPRLLLICTAVLAVAAIGTTLAILQSRLSREETPAGQGLVSVPADLSGPFELIDHQGQPRTQADFGGEKVLLYFGYSFCPDVCPTSLQVIAAALDLLGPEGERIRPLFVTVDPDRDTPVALAGYVELFHERMTGLTGDKQKIDAMVREFRAYYEIRKDIAPIDYPVDHSSYSYLLDEDWNLLLVFRHDVSPETMAAAIRNLE